MFDNEDTLGTQVSDVDDVDSQDFSGDTPSGDEGNEPFLVVDERTQYKTREDALRAYKEAGQRISSLSGWEKEMKQFGVNDPRVAAQLLNELAQRRQEAAAKSSPENQKKSASPETTNSDDDLSEADQKALKWLKKMAPKLGYVPKEELQSLKDEIEAMKTGQQQLAQSSSDARFNSLVESGRSELGKLLATIKIPTSDTRASMAVENFVRAYIDADDDRAKKFFAGGEELKGVIKEAFDEFKYVNGIGKSQVSSSYVGDKTKAQIRNRVLPQQGTGKGKPPQGAAPKKGITADTHNKAWEIFQKGSGQSED